MVTVLIFILALTVSVCLQILGVEVVPFIFSLSGEDAWSQDCEDIVQWLDCQSVAGRTLVFIISSNQHVV